MKKLTNLILMAAVVLWNKKHNEQEAASNKEAARLSIKVLTAKMNATTNAMERRILKKSIRMKQKFIKLNYPNNSNSWYKMLQTPYTDNIKRTGQRVLRTPSSKLKTNRTLKKQYPVFGHDSNKFKYKGSC